MKVGDQVEFVNHKGGGIISKISDEIVWVQLKDGLEIYCGINEVYKSQVYSETITQLHSSPKKNPKKSKEKENTDINWEEKKPVVKKVKDKDFNVHPSIIGEATKPLKKEKHQEIRWVVDLHIEELVDDFRHLSNGEILAIQLKKFHLVMKDAIKKKIKRLIVIHGVGKGVLKTEILNESSNYTILSIHDASYLEFGKGATEIILSTQ